MRSDARADDDDRTGRARIRDAAIARFAEDGVAATTVRAIATDAGVSPGLVIHHFGSKAALRAACDQHVAAVIREGKTAAMREGLGLDPLAAMRAQHDAQPLLRYLARTLVDGSPHVAELVDEMAHDAAAYMQQGVETGVLRPSAHPTERAAVLTIWSLGALVLHEHLRRLLDVDLIGDPAGALRYLRPASEMFAEGLLTPEMAARMRETMGDSAMADSAMGESAPDPAPTSTTPTGQETGS